MMGPLSIGMNNPWGYSSTTACGVPKFQQGIHELFFKARRKHSAVVVEREMIDWCYGTKLIATTNSKKKRMAALYPILDAVVCVDSGSDILKYILKHRQWRKNQNSERVASLLPKISKEVGCFLTDRSSERRIL